MRAFFKPYTISGLPENKLFQAMLARPDPVEVHPIYFTISIGFDVTHAEFQLTEWGHHTDGCHWILGGTVVKLPGTYNRRLTAFDKELRREIKSNPYFRAYYDTQHQKGRLIFTTAPLIPQDIFAPALGATA